ncbi:MAG: bifunctional (p)ppGpp synthetase/guanosine-3',5'-bis(diphosphate) 3'-pyrophosphohydrolase, partial [Candidatus Paceibacteria bacterium]
MEAEKYPKKGGDIDDLIEKVKVYKEDADTDLIRLAYDYAKEAHEGQTRKSGKPYIEHPLAAAHIVANMRIDPLVVVGTLLHDVPEDTDKTLEDLEENFGEEIRDLVAGITKMGKLKYRGVERYIENLRKLFVAMAEDVRTMIIKFADRVHNLSTLEHLPEKKRYRIALESLEIYAPIAARLGMDEFKGRLEDLSFKYVYPEKYEEVKELREQKLGGKKDYFKEVSKKAERELKKADIDVLNVQGRNKRLYSFYKKLQRKGEVAKIYDLIALRVIVPSVADCYAALGTIHKIWKPMRGRIKDYISQPKPNGYKSLHTTVFGKDGEMIEFQIRTEEMHEEAQYGVAAHWHYDEHGSSLPKKSMEWVDEFADIQENVLNELSDLEELKVDFLKKRLFVFTPQGDVIDLPEGATPVDFAYKIHTEIGNTCVSARVNNKVVSLDTKLKNSDMVEIITDDSRKGPNPDWLEFVKTSKAKKKIESAKKDSVSDW